MTIFGAKDSTLERMSRGRTDLVFDYIGEGHAATSKSGDAPLISTCAMSGDVSAIRFLLTHGESLESVASVVVNWLLADTQREHRDADAWQSAEGDG